jgi:hypothetical protein
MRGQSPRASALNIHRIETVKAEWHEDDFCNAQSNLITLISLVWLRLFTIIIAVVLERIPLFQWNLPLRG